MGDYRRWGQPPDGAIDKDVKRGWRRRLVDERLVNERLVNERVRVDPVRLRPPVTLVVLMSAELTATRRRPIGGT